MFKFLKKRRGKKQSEKRTTLRARVFRSAAEDGTYYIEYPDGLRLIVRDGRYDGHYVS